MLEEIYLQRREAIDNSIKQAIKKVENQLVKIKDEELEKNKDIIGILEENYNIKLGSICKEIYLQGLKDGINLIQEAKGNPSI